MAKKTSKFRFRTNPDLQQLVHEMSSLGLHYDLADIADVSFYFDNFNLPTVTDAQAVVDLYRKADGHAIYVVLNQEEEDSTQAAYFFIAPLKETKTALTALINEERRNCAQAPTRICSAKKVLTCSTVGQVLEASCLRPSRAPKSMKSWTQ